MSLIQADGFALYGTGATSRTNMLLGVYAEATLGAISCETTNPRGQGTHHLRVANVSSARIRRVLGADYAAGLGLAAAFFPSVLPNANDLCALFQARDGANTAQWSVVLQSDGTVSLKLGAVNGTEIAASAVGAIVAGAYQHVEVFGVTAESPGGSVEVRVDGQTIINATGVDTRNGLATVTQYVIGYPSANAATVLDVADLAAWNDLGGINDDFLGDVQWLPWFPTSDGSATDWTRNTGSNDYETIDDTTPDGDTTYIESTAAGQVSTFGLTNVPANTSDIIGVVTQPMARKTDAGNGNMQVGLVVAGSPSTDLGADTPITEVYTYYPEVFETDPSTGVRFTPSGFNGLELRLERTL